MLCATSVKSFFEDDFGGTFDGGSMWCILNRA